MRVGGLLLPTTMALLVLPASAPAANTFVDQTRPDNNGDCFTPATACKTFTGPGGAVAKTGAGDTAFAVDPDAPTTYNDTIVLDSGKSLVAQSPDPAETIIDNGTAAAPAVTVPGAGTGTVRGFTIRSDHRAIDVQGPATIRDNVFDDPGPLTTTSESDIEIATGAGSPTITANTFTDTTTTDEQTAILSNSTGSPVISQNTFSGFSDGILLFSNGGATPQVSGNTITGTHDTMFRGTGISIGNGVNASVTGNLIHSPGSGVPFAISVFQNDTTRDVSASLRRNRILGHQVGVQTAGSEGAVTLHSDLIAKANGAGLLMNEVGGNGGGDVTATNVTVIDTVSGPEIQLGNGVTLTLDSSIVGAGGLADPGISDTATGNCIITFSRGSGDNDCATGFVTTAEPQFVDPASNNYHLQAGSPMTDAGNPAAPSPGATDFDGDPRAIDGNGDCTARRDIGADERLVPPNPACSPPPPGDGGDTQPSNEFTIGALNGKRLEVTVPGPGTVEVADAAEQNAGGVGAVAGRKRLKRSSATAGGAGTIEVRLKLTGKAKKKLTRKGRVKVNGAVTFTPTGGAANTETAKLKVKKRRR